MGGLQALKLWQSGRYTDKGLPPTWDCLLTAIEEEVGPRVSEQIAGKALMEKNWSIDHTGKVLCEQGSIQWGREVGGKLPPKRSQL